MIEQSFEHGSVYLSYIRKSMLVSKSIKVADITFGLWRPITIYQDGTFVYMEDARTKTVYVYENGKFQTQSDTISPPGDGVFYYYGLAKYKDPSTGHDSIYPYYVQNQPHSTLDILPDINRFEIPRTLQDLGYDQTFDYIPELTDLLCDVPATYVDRFKRPITIKEGRIYPTSMNHVTTRVSDLQPSNYPIVVDLSTTDYAVVDLEPGYTEHDLAHFKTIPGYYVEDTPRGGKHLLVALQSAVFKYRYSEHLEVINNGMVTLYGINASLLNPKPEFLDVTPYQSTIRTASKPVSMDPVREDIQKYVDLLKEQNRTTASRGVAHAQNTLDTDPDPSHGEYVALFTLFKYDLQPYEQHLPKDALPWILEAYAREIIGHRDKHETQRNGVPYLVYLANEVIQYNNSKARKADNL